MAEVFTGPPYPSALLTTQPLYIMAADKHTETWPELAIGLYDKLTGRGAEITYEFENMEVHVPSGTGDNVTHAHWKMNGTIKIRTQDTASDG